MSRGASFAAAFAALWLGSVGCRGQVGQTSEPGSGPDDRVSQSVEALAASDPNAIMGFESATAWTAGGALSATPIRTQGSFALQITNPPNDTDLTSAPVASTATALQGLGDASSSFSVDVTLPNPPRNPNNPGSMQLFVSCPSRGIKNANLGQVAFTGMHLGIYTTVKFAIPDNVRQALGGATYGDLVFDLRLHTPGNHAATTPTYLFDNLRVHSPAAPPPATARSVDLVALLSYSPPSSTPGSQTFPLGVVQIPQSFHVRLGSAKTGSARLDLGFEGTPNVTCAYGASADGTSYVFSSCSNGALAGDLTGADFARLTILGGDPSAGTTKIRAQLAVNPAGDTTGSGVIPPMPTFWGDDATSSNQIITDYFNAANAASPTEERWITAPVPDFARRLGDTTPYNELSGVPPPPNDPQFGYDQHLNRGGQWDAYWQIGGNLSWATGAEATTDFNANLQVDVVVWGHDLKVAQFLSTIHTGTGTIQQTGFGPATATGGLHGFLFGSEMAGGGDNLSSFNSVHNCDISGDNLCSSITYDAPPIEIWIFAITVGVDAAVGVSVDPSTSFSGNGFTLTNWAPFAEVGAHLEGGVNIGIASGGVEAHIDLLRASTPVQATAYWTNIDTDQSACNAQLSYSVHGQAQLSTLGGRVDLVATLGICPFCLHADQPIFAWNGIDLGTQDLFDYAGGETDGLPSPATACFCPTTVANCGDGLCANAASAQHCGTCGNVCPSGDSCAAGACISPGVTCASNVNSPCGSCNGVVACDGSCSVPTPANFGSGCGGCGGTVQCDGSCSVGTPPNLGAPCSSCGGTIQCDGSCNVPDPPGLGGSCGLCGGTVTCSGACSIYTPPEQEIASAIGDACCGSTPTDVLVWNGACPNGELRGSCAVTNFASSDTSKADCGATWVNPSDPYDCTCKMHYASDLFVSVHCSVAVTEQPCN